MLLRYLQFEEDWYNIKPPVSHFINTQSTNIAASCMSSQDRHIGSRIDQGCVNLRHQDAMTNKVLYRGAEYLWALSVELVSCLSSGAQNFEVAASLFWPWQVGPCHYGMAPPQVADRGTASSTDGSCEYVE